MCRTVSGPRGSAAFVLGAAIVSSLALAQPAAAQLAMTETDPYPGTVFREVMPSDPTYGREPARDPAYSRDPAYRQPSPQYETPAPELSAPLPQHLRRQLVNYPTREIPGTIVIDTSNTYLYYVVGNGRAIRYGIGVGREGFTWAGTEKVKRKQEWPDWHPPAEMIARQPYLPRFMSGGPGNPLGARAMYLGNSLYRIHGTNEPHTIGQRVSSGCIRLLNEDVEDLYNRVTLGAKVVVLNNPQHRVGPNVASVPEPAPQPMARNDRRYEAPRYDRRYEQPVFEADDPSDPRYDAPVVYVPRPQVEVPFFGPPVRPAPYYGTRVY